VGVPANERETLLQTGSATAIQQRWKTWSITYHVRSDTQTLIDLAAGFHARSRAHWAEPVDVVLDDEEAARRDQGSEEMMVFGDGRGLARVGIELGREPCVLTNDLAGGLDVLALGLLGIADAPAGCASRAGLLRDGQGNTCTACQWTLFRGRRDWGTNEG
jgi:hypothetical protein